MPGVRSAPLKHGVPCEIRNVASGGNIHETAASTLCLSSPRGLAERTARPWGCAIYLHHTLSDNGGTLMQRQWNKSER